jgi:hypothetical protein
MNGETKNDLVASAGLFRTAPDVVKTEWKPLGWGRRWQTRIKVGATGELYLQTVVQGCFKRLISAIFHYLTCGTVKSFGKNVVEFRSQGHSNPIKIDSDLGLRLTARQKSLLAARQQAHLGVSFTSLKEKVSAKLREWREVQKQYSEEMRAYEELRRIIDYLTTMEEQLNAAALTIADPEERFRQFCLSEAQYHFFVRDKEQKLQQWQSGAGKELVSEAGAQKQQLQSQFNELQALLSQHLTLLMQKREECDAYPNLHRRLSDRIVACTETQTKLIKIREKEVLDHFKEEAQLLFRRDQEVLTEIEQQKNAFQAEAETYKQKAFDEQIRGGKELLKKHIDQLQQAAEKYIPGSKPEQEIRQMVERHLQSLNQEIVHRENDVNGFLKDIGSAMQQDHLRLKEILDTYSLPSSGSTKPALVLSLCFIEKDPLPFVQSESSPAPGNIQEDIKHLLTTLKAHARQARQGGYLALDKEIRGMVIRFNEKNKEFQSHVKNPSSSSEKQRRELEMGHEVSDHLKQLAKVHQLMAAEQTLKCLGTDVSARIHQFARRLPGEVLLDEDVARLQERIQQLGDVDPATLTSAQEQLADILSRQRQLIALCYSTAEKYIRLKNEILDKELHLLAQREVHAEVKIQFLFSRREAEWASLLKHGPACVSPGDLAQWSQKVFANGIFDETLIEVLKKYSSGTLDEVREIVATIGLEGKSELVLPKQADNSLQEHEMIKRHFDDLTRDRTTTLTQMKTLLKDVEEKVKTWEKRELISPEAAHRWSRICTSLQAKCECIELLLEYDALAVGQYVAYLEERRAQLIQTQSSELVVKWFDKYFKKVQPFAKWDFDAPLKMLDTRKTLWDKTFEKVQKKFQLVQAVDENEKAYSRVGEHARQLIFLWNQNGQFVNLQKIQDLLESQADELKKASINSSKSLAEYEKHLLHVREKLEDEIDLTQDMSSVDQLNLVPEDSPQADALRKAVVEDLSKKVNAHLEELKGAEEELKAFWMPYKSTWQQQIIERLENKRVTLSRHLQLLSQPQTRGRLIELQTQVQDEIHQNLAEIENQTYLSKIIGATKRYESFIEGSEKKIDVFRGEYQFSHAHRLSRILLKEKERCATLKKELTSSSKMHGYALALETAVNNVEAILKHIDQIGPVSAVAQMKEIKSQHPEDFELLHQHFRQGMDRQIQEWQHELNDYQKRVSSAIATLQHEINVDQQRKLKDGVMMDKLFSLSEKLNQLEVLQAKILEQNTLLQKLQDQFSVWTYAVWMGKQPLPVSRLTPDQLLEYQDRVNETLAKCRSELTPLLTILNTE